MTIEKDGVEQDVYGDGIYREGEDWYVPGFQNLMEKESWEKADIRIIIAKDPVANYIGTSSLFRNLELMPERIKIPPLLPEHRAEILRGLDGILSQEHLDKTWEMISRRYAYYEAL